VNYCLRRAIIVAAIRLGKQNGVAALHDLLAAAILPTRLDRSAKGRTG
jgi:hypothetical protein